MYQTQTQSFRCPIELAELLAKRARKDKVSKSKVVIHLLRESLIGDKPNGALDEIVRGQKESAEVYQTGGAFIVSP